MSNGISNFSQAYYTFNFFRKDRHAILSLSLKKRNRMRCKCKEVDYTLVHTHPDFVAHIPPAPMTWNAQHISSETQESLEASAAQVTSV